MARALEPEELQRPEWSDRFGGRQPRAPAGPMSPALGLQDRHGMRGVVRMLERSRQGAAALAADAGAIHAAADEGTRGAGAPLPHAEAIQRAFGRHDVGDVEAHVGGRAAIAADAMAANAFATGSHVAFAEQPDLHTAAHEAAHVVQQRNGSAQLTDGVGRRGDEMERNADAVADAVVRGESAEPLLERGARAGTAGGASAPAVQRQGWDFDPAHRAALTPPGDLHVPRLGSTPSWTEGLRVATVPSGAEAASAWMQYLQRLAFITSYLHTQVRAVPPPGIQNPAQFGEWTIEVGAEIPSIPAHPDEAHVGRIEAIQFSARARVEDGEITHFLEPFALVRGPASPEFGGGIALGFEIAETLALGLEFFALRDPDGQVGGRVALMMNATMPWGFHIVGGIEGSTEGGALILRLDIPIESSGGSE